MFNISNSFFPLGVSTDATSFSSLPIRALAIGELIEIMLFLISASSSPTIEYVISFSLSKSKRITVALKTTLLDVIFFGSTISALESLSLISLILPSQNFVVL